MQLFCKKGYGSTSVADMLQAARVNSGSLYHFFPGKQDLLLAVLDAYHEGIGPMLLEPAWRGVERSHRAHLRPARPLPPVAADSECLLRLPDRQPRAGAARAGPAGARAPGGEFRRLDGCHRGVPRRLPAPACPRTSTGASSPRSCSRPWRVRSCRRAPSVTWQLSTAPCASCVPISSGCWAGATGRRRRATGRQIRRIPPAKEVRRTDDISPRDAGRSRRAPRAEQRRRRRRSRARLSAAGLSRRTLLARHLPRRQGQRRALLQLDLWRQVPARRTRRASRRRARGRLRRVDLRVGCAEPAAAVPVYRE